MSTKEEPHAIFARLAKRARPYVPFTFPKRTEEEEETHAVLVILSESEMQSCAAAAQKHADAKTKESPSDNANHSNRDGWSEIYNDEKLVQLLAISLRETGYPREDLRLVPDARSLRDALNPDELGVLGRAYFNLRADCGPIISEISGDELEAWIKKLVEGGKRSFLSRLSAEALTDLLMHSAALLKTYWTINGQSGSPQDESSTKQESEVGTDSV